MAQIDFSNASIESLINQDKNLGWNVNGQSNYLGLAGHGNLRFTKSDYSWNSITSALTTYITQVTEHGFVCLYDGVVNTSGNDILMLVWKNTSGFDRELWRIYNIEYEAGDTFHFQIRADFNFS